MTSVFSLSQPIGMTYFRNPLLHETKTIVGWLLGATAPFNLFSTCMVDFGWVILGFALLGMAPHAFAIFTPSVWPCMCMSHLICMMYYYKPPMVVPWVCIVLVVGGSPTDLPTIFEMVVRRRPICVT